MKILGICTLNQGAELLNYEKYSLYQEAQKRYDQVLLINPKLVIYKFVRGQEKPLILYENTDISGLSSLIVRSTASLEAPIAILVRSLKICGCDIFDPIERFSVGKASKLLTTISRFQKGIGTSTYISFTKSGALTLIGQLDEARQFPLLTKPIAGKQGKGVAVIHDVREGLDYINQYFGHEEYQADPFFLQDMVSFEKEYRVFIIDGKALGIAEKIKVSGTATANASQGATFVRADAPYIIEATLQNVSDEGILGVDVALDSNGEIHIIETNRAPQWQAFEKATGINVAKAIIDRSFERLA